MKMRIIIKEPQNAPYVAEIENDLSAMQKIVGGYIETVPFFVEGVLAVCNEEGKLEGLTPNFALGYDTIVGTAFFVHLGAEDFESLSDDEIKAVKAALKGVSL